METCTENKGIRLMAVVTAALTLVLILAGGFVTTTATGDTIPTWPKTWGKMESGWIIEASHRYVAATVGMLVLVLAVWLQRAEVRAWVRGVGWMAFGGVLVQAMIGGLRIYVPRAAVSIVHACFGQLVFCAMVAIALFVSRAWFRAAPDESASSARRLGAVTTLAAFLQLVAGAVTRHTGSGLLVHLVGAMVVLTLTSVFVSRLLLTPLRKGALLLTGILALQILLGIATWAITTSGFVRSHESPVFMILTVSAHVAVGAALLAASLGVTLLCHRGEPSVTALEGARA